MTHIGLLVRRYRNKTRKTPKWEQKECGRGIIDVSLHRRGTSVDESKKQGAQSHAVRCTHHRSALHRLSQHAAWAHAAHCVRRAIRLPLSAHLPPWTHLPYPPVLTRMLRSQKRATGGGGKAPCPSYQNKSTQKKDNGQGRGRASSSS